MRPNHDIDGALHRRSAFQFCGLTIQRARAGDAGAIELAPRARYNLCGSLSLCGSGGSLLGNFSSEVGNLLLDTFADNIEREAVDVG